MVLKFSEQITILTSLFYLKANVFRTNFTRLTLCSVIYTMSYIYMYHKSVFSTMIRSNKSINMFSIIRIFIAG